MLFSPSCTSFRFGYSITLPVGTVISIHSGSNPSDPPIATHVVTVSGPLLAQMTALANDLKSQLDVWSGSPPGTWQANVVPTSTPLGTVVIFESPINATSLPWANPSSPQFHVSFNGGFLGPTVLPNGFMVQRCDTGSECSVGNTVLTLTLSQVGAGNKLFIYPAGIPLTCTDGISSTPSFTVGPNLYDAAHVFGQSHLQNLPGLVVGYTVSPHPDALLNYSSTTGTPITIQMYFNLGFCPVDFIACSRDKGSQDFSPPSDFEVTSVECCNPKPCISCLPLEYWYLLTSF